MLVGVSRGAGLAVVAAGELHETITGVVAVALTQEEEYVRWDRHLPLTHDMHQPVMVDVYEYIAQLGNLPLAVVQSTHDQYLPAAKAREEFRPRRAVPLTFSPSRQRTTISAAPGEPYVRRYSGSFELGDDAPVTRRIHSTTRSL